MAAPLSVIILTYNEEANLSSCLASLQGWVRDIFVVDCGSTDQTVKLAREYTDNIIMHPWENYARQLNWALDHLPLSQEWVMRLDADEAVTPELADELCRVLPHLPPDITGLYVRRRVYFMDRWIRHGGYYPTWLLRFWRRGKAKIEERWMDEHVVLFEGRTSNLQNDIEERNKKDLTWWTNKHNSYATREANDLINITLGRVEGLNIKPSFFGSQEARKRWLKENVYVRCPLFLRAIWYFLYRYFVRLGFLDGREGLIFHFLQACWYRFLVDAKIDEYKRAFKKERERAKA